MTRRGRDGRDAHQIRQRGRTGRTASDHADDAPPKLQRNADKSGHAALHASALCENIEVKAGKELVFSLATGISLAKDPVITFGVPKKASGPLTVTAEDSEHGSWRQTYDLPAAMD